MFLNSGECGSVSVLSGYVCRDSYIRAFQTKPPITQNLVRPLEAGAPARGPGKGAGEAALLGGRVWPDLASGNPQEWLHESHFLWQGSSVSGWGHF